MAEMNNEEIRARLLKVEGNIKALEREKAQLEIKQEDFQNKVDALRPDIEKTFGTTDESELKAKRSELLDKLNKLDLSD